MQEAIAEFERALALDPVDVDAYRALAGAYERSGRPDRAEATYRRAIELRPQDWASFKDLGVFYFWNGRLREAESCFRRVIELAPDSYWGYRNLGAVYCSMGRFGEAITQSERSISILPTAPAYSNLGATYFMQGRFSDAARAYEQAIGLGAADERLLRGNLAEAYRHLPGSTAKAASEYGRAMQLAARALEVNPQNAEIRASLALYAIGLGDRARALAEIARPRSLPRQHECLVSRRARQRVGRQPPAGAGFARCGSEKRLSQIGSGPPSRPGGTSARSALPGGGPGRTGQIGRRESWRIQNTT